MHTRVRRKLDRVISIYFPTYPHAHSSIENSKLGKFTRVCGELLTCVYRAIFSQQQQQQQPSMYNIIYVHIHGHQPLLYTRKVPISRNFFSLAYLLPLLFFFFGREGQSIRARHNFFPVAPPPPAAHTKWSFRSVLYYTY